MAPPHIMSPSKQIRPGPNVKSIDSRSLVKAHLSKDARTQLLEPPQPDISSMFNEIDIIEQFRRHRERELDAHPSSDIAADDDEVRRQVSYTREQKLAAITGATTTRTTNKHGLSKPISKYAAAQQLGITTKMLRD